MILLVVGASGHLGGEVARRAPAAGFQVVGTARQAPSWEPLDVRDPFAVHQLFQRVRPAAVVNCAYQRGSWTATADGAANVAAAAAATGSRLVHISSDALHAGRPRPYTEDDEPSPVHAYGAAKAAAETAVRALDPSAAVVRTSLILGPEHTPQVKFCLDVLRGEVSGSFFSDEIRCPVADADLADAVLELVGNDYAGILNVAGAQALTRPELARLVGDAYGLSTADIPVSTVAASGLVRPADVKLDISRAAGVLKTRLRSAAEFLVS
ncbi:sugar nucleotide-binding protein [Hamadaea tsunoensis]|uniref:sugar nucleotide-binding protein n=1 Tax=Hamadaea tsunoensis TaxID=53368 RepID=UPI000423DAEB|nr:sugar nucleotide-binding protein [Hamadaea tsunoensis]